MKYIVTLFLAISLISCASKEVELDPPHPENWLDAKESPKPMFPDANISVKEPENTEYDFSGLETVRCSDHEWYDYAIALRTNDYSNPRLQPCVSIYLKNRK